MLWLLLFMVLVLSVAGLVVVYVAYPHRGEQVPGVPVIGEMMTSAARAIQVLGVDEDRPRAGAR